MSLDDPVQKGALRTGNYYVQYKKMAPEMSKIVHVN